MKIDPDAGHAVENPDNKQGDRCTNICAFCGSAVKAEACIYAAFHGTGRGRATSKKHS